MSDQIVAWGQVAGALATILGLATLIVRTVILKPLKSYIKELTYPIQPTANGGKSLPDIAGRVEALHDLLAMHIDTHHKP